MSPFLTTRERLHASYLNRPVVFIVALIRVLIFRTLKRRALTTVLDGIPNALERAKAGETEARRGKTVPLDDI